MALDGYTHQRLSRQAMRAELLDAETESQLARAWRDERDQAALNRLIHAYMRLAISMAAKFRRYGTAMNDLIQTASLGLMKAADKFDPDRGVRFSTYAVWWVKAELQEHVMRDWSLVRTGSTSGQKTLFFNLARVRSRLDRELGQPGPVALRAAVAAELGVSLGDVEMMEARLSGGDFSLNAVQAGEGEGREWVDLLEDDAPRPAETVEAAHDLEILRGWLSDALNGLSPRERLIVTERQLRAPGRTLESLGQELGLSKERVRQIEAAAHGKLRVALETGAPGIADLL